MDCCFWRLARSRIAYHAISPIGLFEMLDPHVHVEIVGPLSPPRGVSYFLIRVIPLTFCPEATSSEAVARFHGALNICDHCQSRSPIGIRIVRQLSPYGRNLAHS